MKIRYFFISLAVLALVLTGLFTYTGKQRLLDKTGDNTTTLAKAVLPPGGPFELTDKHGQRVNSSSLEGKYRLIFFGFTYCPDICPMSLMTISKALEQLGSKAEQIIPVFISLDPGRDTPSQLKDYMESFDPRILALTGTDEEIKQVAAAFKVFYSKEENPSSPNDYLVNHSGFIYFMDKQGNYLTHFSHDTSIDAMVNTLSHYE